MALLIIEPYDASEDAPAGSETIEIVPHLGEAAQAIHAYLKTYEDMRVDGEPISLSNSFVTFRAIWHEAIPTELPEGLPAGSDMVFKAYLVMNGEPAKTFDTGIYVLSF